MNHTDLTIDEDVIDAPEDFTASVFWQDCRTCRGRGTVKIGHPDAIPVNGYPTGVPCPDRRSAQSGTGVTPNPDPHAGRAFCGKCLGCGMQW